MNKGETFQEAAQRGVQRELGLNIDASRYMTLGTYSLVWPNRRELPAANGCHHLLVAAYVYVNDEEAASATYGEDHEELRWVRLHDDLPEGSSNYLVEIVADLRRLVSRNSLNRSSNLSASLDSRNR